MFLPNRILREGILGSRAVNNLSESAELLYRRLINVVDDYGRFDWDVDLIRARAFPLQLDRWPIDRLKIVLQELAQSPLLTIYMAEQKQYFEIANFGQRIQSRGRYPSPTGPDSTVIHGDPPLKTVTRAGARARSESESYTKSESYTSLAVDTNLEAAAAAAALPEKQQQQPKNGSFPLCMKAIWQHDQGIDSRFIPTLIKKIGSRLASNPDVLPQKAALAITDKYIAEAITESYATYKGKEKHGSGLLLHRVPEILLSACYNHKEPPR